MGLIPCLGSCPDNPDSVCELPAKSWMLIRPLAGSLIFRVFLLFSGVLQMLCSGCFGYRVIFQRAQQGMQQAGKALLQIVLTQR